VTYRDDHEAAVARAESLEQELSRVARERDQLRAKLGDERATVRRDDHEAAVVRAESLAQQLSRVERERDQLSAKLAEGAAIAVSAPTPASPLTEREVDDLVGELEASIFSARWRSSLRAFFGVVSAIVFIAMIPSAATAIAMSVVVVIAIAIHARERAHLRAAAYLPVLTSLRAAPERITRIWMSGSDTHWITIHTADHWVRLRVTNAVAVLAVLARRCPGARFE
jgi:hypothetical protein